MGMRRMFTVCCDVCLIEADNSHWWAEAARAEAIADGWKLTRTKFICPDCQT